MSLAIDFHGVPLTLLPDRALLDPGRRRLFVADLHLGKAAHFRRAGLPLPRGTTRADLDRLHRLLSTHDAAELLVLGDVVHAAAPDTDGWRARWLALREAHAHRRFLAVAGNHDRHGLAGLGFDHVHDAIEREGLLLLHAPDDGDPRPQLCGHLHPVLRLRDEGLSARLPAFWRQARRLVLPAFGGFTGGVEVRPGRGEVVYACAGAELIAVKGPGGESRR